MTSESSTVMRPKSIATVVVTFALTSDASSTSFDSVVIAASVVSGGISDTAETKVVLPTPNPPATTSLTDVTLRDRGATGARVGADGAGRHGWRTAGADGFKGPGHVRSSS